MLGSPLLIGDQQHQVRALRQAGGQVLGRGVRRLRHEAATIAVRDHPGVVRTGTATVREDGLRTALPGPLALACGALCLFLCLWLWLGAVPSVAQPVEQAAPYEYMGWGDPQPPAEVLADTGLHDLTLAFILSRGKCNPEWDGRRPLLGGSDQAAIERSGRPVAKSTCPSAAGAARSWATACIPRARSPAPTRR